MANNDQEESALPTSGNEPRRTANLLPRTYRTDSNKKFLQATLDQLTQPGKVKKLNGYIGQQNSKSAKSDDIYIDAPDQIRQTYQLEPGAVIQDKFENVTFFKDYIDYVNQINVLGGDTANHERLNKQEFYSWNPHIDWDKFVNFQNYYWLPYGPEVIKVYGQQLEIESTYTVNIVDEDDNYAYVLTPDALTRNPIIRLFRGQTYNFTVNSPGNPFSFKTTRTTGNLDVYINGVSAHSIEKGTITWKVRHDAPDVIYYVSETDINAGGIIQIFDIEDNTFLDIQKDILGKKDYTLNSGVKISNGMKLNFEGNVSPANYKDGIWYVEGVGSAIKLIPESALQIVSTYTEESELLFDDTAFDQDPFSVASSYPKNNDYICISRGAKDRNPWSRYNRWFHQDVIKVSAEANGNIPDFDQTARAIRPIIEFEADIKLHNFGHVNKADVDLIDNFTTDVFSTIEGSTGYNIDGIDVVNGMRVLFTADPDILVNGKIFKVNFINVIVPQRQIEFLASSAGVNAVSDVITIPAEHGLSTGSQVTYLNNGNTSINGLVNRQQYYVYAVSTTEIKLYNDKALTKLADIFAPGANTHKFEVFSGLRRQINLVEDVDAVPQQHETVLIKNGVANKGYMYWYTGTAWKLGQVKSSVNQSPLFDVFDLNEVSYSDTLVYDSSTFNGTKLFSYKVGTGSNDTSLGFPLSYKNINNVGDIVFNFNLLQDSFNYKNSTSVLSKKTEIGYLKKINSLTEWSYENGWTKSDITNVQPVVRIFKESGLVNNFPVDVYDDQNDLSDLEVRVYVNGKRLNREQYVLERGVVRYSVVLDTDVSTTDIVTLRCFANQVKNNLGHYEIPISLQNNPLNKNLETFTLGEVVDHVGTIVDNITTFNGAFPGNGNLRDLGNLSAYGVRVVQHSSPMNHALYHFGKEEINVIKALVQAQEDYATFKRSFLIAASNTGVEMDARRHVDLVLENLAKDKPKLSSYYLSDMFGSTGATRLETVIEDPRTQRILSIANAFSLAALSNKAVYVYRNGEQMIEGKDYVFGNNDVFFRLITDQLAEGDTIEVFEYVSTDGSFCPPTPTKLGLYPKYEPKKYIDDTYLEPRTVIQGHDGSITLGFDDYRDDMLLELELRIYNNLKTQYDPSIFDIWDYIPGYTRTTEYTKEEFERVLSPSFFQWTNTINQDYTKQAYWDKNEPFTFNYRDNYFVDGTDSPAFWRGIYDWLFDTDRPHTHPWECLGYGVPPAWWESVYGPAPYTKDNQLLWEDLAQGIIREPGFPPRYYPKFARSILLSGAPTDELGNLVSPLETNYVSGTIKATAEGYYKFGDQGPIETAWRRSSYYPFAIIKTLLLLRPNQIMATCFDRSRQVKNLTNQLIYSPSGLRFKLSDVVLPSNSNSTSRIYAAGLVNYIVDYATTDITFKLDEYTQDLQSLTNKLSYKLGGFTSKTKFNILLDSKSPTSSGGVFVPEDNFNVFFNVSTPIKKVSYSGIVISKYPDGFELRGYNVDEPYFTYYPYRQNDRVIRVGGISESYTLWTSGKTYVAGKTISYSNDFYKVKFTHQAGDTFDSSLYSKLPGLPVIGGTEAILRKAWDTNQELYLAYGTKLATIQEVVDFIQGYSVYLEQQGFEFNQYNPALKAVTNWETSINEFLFWTTQGWGEGAALSLSPAANKLVLKSNSSVVDDIRNSFYGYKIFRVDGQLLQPEFGNTFRDENAFVLSPSNTNHGIYGAILYLVQKEHVLLLDNTTLFNDTIYDQEPGYRQERVKVIGYVTSNWDGSFNVPGFIYDQAIITDWEQWTDYNLGDIVKHKEFYYSALKFIVGSESFESENWTKLAAKPTPQLLPNWDYRAEQFTDFYDLDTDNFDSGQQKIAQHLIGYQNRQYLQNIIKDDVSQYKFYQGMIIEKGTQNVLNKLFDVLSADDQDSLTFNEEWAVRVGEYGASNAFDEVEFKLDETQFKLNPQPIVLVNEMPVSVDLIYRIKTGDVYVRPIGYNNNPWPTTGVKKSLRSPGYVRYEDVKTSVDVLTDATVSANISSFEEGDYVWAAFEGRDWNVYRFSKNTFYLDDIEYANGVLTLQCDRIPNLAVGDTIGIMHTASVNGFFVIDAIEANRIKINTVIENWTPPFADSAQVLTYRFIQSRISNIDDANAHLPPYIKNGELLWADDNGQGYWTVYQNKKVYSRDILENNTTDTDLKFGIKTSVSKDGRVVAVSNTHNEIQIYEKSLATNTWYLTQTIVPETNLVASSSNLGFGLETAFSPDRRWLAIAAPTASAVKSTWVGVYDESQGYSFSDTVVVRNTHFSAKKSVSASDTSTLNRFTEDWVPAYLVKTEASRPANANVNQGYVNIYERSPGGVYQFKHSFVSPYPTSGELFGSKMTFAKNESEYVLAITSAGYNNNQGRVYLYRYAALEEDSSVSGWHMDYHRTYMGFFDKDVPYYPGDIVFYNYELYRCLQTTARDVLRPGQPKTSQNDLSEMMSSWELLDRPSILGFFPQQVASSDIFATVYPTLDETVESVFQGDKFGYDVKMSLNGKKLVISAPYADQNTFTNYKGLYRTDERYDLNDVVYYTGGIETAGYYRYERTFDSSVAGTFTPADWALITSQSNPNTGKVFVYEYQDDGYILVDTLGSQNLNLEIEDRFGDSIAISDSGSHLAVGSTLYTGTKSNQGCVTIFESYSGTFAPYQTLTSIFANPNDKFGTFVEFMNDAQTLVVFSPNGDITNETSFDDYTTTFDNNTLRIVDLQIDSGRVDIFDRYASNFIYGESLSTASVNDKTDGYGSSIAVGRNNILVSAPLEEDQNYQNSGVMYAYSKPASKTSWSVLHYERPRANAYKIKKAFLYNKVESKLVSYLDIVDPIQGKIPGPADQEIKFKTYFDPATYTVGSSSVNVDDGMAWTTTQVGMLWWDLTNSRFLDNQGGEEMYRATTWNKLYKSASIDVYEWIESKYLPSEWDKQSGTEKGLGLGISGSTKYGDAVYSVKRRYDTVSKTFVNTYYYWVKNPTILPNKEGRILTANEVSRLISDPVSYGYPCLALLGSGSFSLVNCSDLLENKDVVLSVQYWTVENQTNNAHTQWKVISEHINTIIPYEIENKWLDSLLGKDKNGRTVPDLKLPVKQRYGIENRPRQGMFVNRIEALKQFIDRTNSVLKENLIVDEFDLTDLQRFEEQPSALTGLWDVTVDTDPELRFVGTNLLQQAQLTPMVEDGKIVNVDIVTSGRGYINAPYLKIVGSGKDAVIKAVLDDIGSIIGVEIINQGSGYNDSTLLSIRPFAVLVKSDASSYDKWSIYTWVKESRTWVKGKTQTYDVTKFWDYTDWYVTGYDQFTKINHVVDNTYQLAILESSIGHIVKVKNIGAGGWVLLEKYNNVVTIDYTQNYKVVGRENGTIMFLDSLYNFKSVTLGFDGPLYDSDQYDSIPTTELSIILTAIKDKILVDNLRTEYLKLFFSSVRYALQEQPFLDWIMKTSFVKATHNAGPLVQKTNYNSDNLSDFENYVNEVKPYRTKVREYVSAYTRLDNTQTSVTDFDLPPVIDNEFSINPLTVLLDENYALGSTYAQLFTDPWKHWYDNASYSIESIDVVDGGSGYTDNPVVNIIDDYGIVTSTNTLKSNFDGPSSSWALGEGTMKIMASGLPYHSYGNPVSTNTPTSQSYSQVIPLRGGANVPGTKSSIPLGKIGYWLNGVAIFNPNSGDTAPDGYSVVDGYNYDVAYNLGTGLGYNVNEDLAGGYATATGVYQYHDYDFSDAWLTGIGNTFNDVERSETEEIPYLRDGLQHSDGHSKILGFSLDGYPVYGPNGYSVATDPTSSVVRMVSGYEIKAPSYRTGGTKDTTTYPMGIFVQDYEFTGVGTLDIHNGRYCITPDYPNGTYAYFITQDDVGNPVFPYVVGPTYYGDPAPQDRNDASDGKGMAPKTYNIFNSAAVQATAKAYITNGKISRIVLTTAGSGYLKTPRIVISGGLSDAGTPARAVAVLKQNPIRSNKVTIKFDRTSKNYFITELTSTETFTGTGSKVQFSLRFSPVTIIGCSTVKINGVEVLRDDYSVSTKKSTTKGYTSYYGLLTFETAPAKDAVIEITYDKNFEHLAAVDRINYYYNPITGQLGKDLAQLMTGVDYGGVIVTGLGFGIGGGWDSQPWFSEGWDGYDVNFDDYIVTVGDSTYTFVLPYVPEDGQEINIYVNGQRIDDEYFDLYDGVTVQPNGRTTAPDGRYMQTWIGDGLSKTIELPNLTSTPALDINDGDSIIFRKSTSDGSVSADPKSYDTQLQGGNLAYTTATGFAPDDIVVDGEGFITPNTSHAPEEVVPGHITDTLSIKVFRLPNSGSSTVLFKNYICDGVETTFDVGQFPNNTAAIFAKLGNQILKQNVDYTVDWPNRKIVLGISTANKQILSVMSFGAASSDILDTDYFVADGSTVEFITNAPWPSLVVDNSFEDSLNRLGSIVLANDQAVEYELFRTDESYETTGFVGIRFPEPVSQDIVINYMITGNANQTVSVFKSQIIDSDGSTKVFALTNEVGNDLPYENFVLVTLGTTLLRSADSLYFTLTENELVYQIPTYKATPYSIDPAEVRAYLDGSLLISGIDYTLDFGALTIEIRDYVYKDNSILTLTRFVDTDYTISGGNIIFDVAPAMNEHVEIITMYNHDIQQIQRSKEFFNVTSNITPGSVNYYQYQSMRGGSITLSRITSADDYIWIAKNRQLLSHSIDFYLNDDLKTVVFKDSLLETDIIDVILFSDNDVTNSFGFMQFKDMLNRTHYKRINKNKSTRLAVELKQKDTQIVVENAAGLTEPNKLMNIPGVVEINSERIEYFVKQGNVLSQLRRATLGTGSPAVHKITSIVLDIGPTETIPYSDKYVVETSIGDGNTRNVSLGYAPTKVDSAWYTETIPAGYGRSDEIEVFVGGYRLKKSPYTLFQETNNWPNSPEGDTTFEAEFSVNGGYGVRLTNEVAENVNITVIKKVGRVWEDAAPPQRIFRNIPLSSGGATIDVVKNSTNYTVTLVKGGSNHSVGDTLIVLGTRIGGASPENDIVITVTDVSDDSSSSILGFTYTGLGSVSGYTTKNLVESNNAISNFLTGTEAVWPQYLVDKYQYVLTTENNETLFVDENNPLELD